MEECEFNELMKKRAYIAVGTKLHNHLDELAAEAQKITSEINGSYKTPAELRALFSQLIGRQVDDNFRLFPPLYTDCGKNIRVGRGVFINSGCCFQDQGGIIIGDGALIGHHVVLATLNHVLAPSRRPDLLPSPIEIGRNVWIGANATILPGVKIGDNTVVAAGAVVTKDLPPDVVAAGVPAKVIKNIEKERS